MGPYFLGLAFLVLGLLILRRGVNFETGKISNSLKRIYIDTGITSGFNIGGLESAMPLAIGLIGFSLSLILGQMVSNSVFKFAGFGVLWFTIFYVLGYVRKYVKHLFAPKWAKPYIKKSIK